MTILAPILELTASIFGWLAARGLDAIVGKWLAFAVIAFEERATDRAKESFSVTMAAIKQNAPEKARAWDEWRKRGETTTPETKSLV